MIKFSQNLGRILPYSREEYIAFLDDLAPVSSKWYAFSVSLSLDRSPIRLSEFLSVFQPKLSHVIAKFNLQSEWILNHDDKDLPWFPEQRTELSSLQNIFLENAISLDYIGFISMSGRDIVSISRQLLSYPYLLEYKNLDISHSKFPLIIKITDHLTLDIICDDYAISEELENLFGEPNFVIRKYRGTV